MSDNEKSRGELKIENNEAIANTILDSQKSDDETPLYNVDNSEFDEFINEAESKQKQETQGEEEPQSEPSLSLQDAMQLALVGLEQITKVASDLTGKPIILGDIPKTLFASLTAPLIQKYKPKIALDPENVDLDSWIPEMMAAGGICAAGLPMYWQINAEPENKEQTKNGD
jgi:hypothetical protein